MCFGEFSFEFVAPESAVFGYVDSVDSVEVFASVAPHGEVFDYFFDHGWCVHLLWGLSSFYYIVVGFVGFGVWGCLWSQWGHHWVL